MPASIVTVVIGLSVTVWDILFYLSYRMEQKAERWRWALDALMERLDRERAGYVETFYLAPITKRALSPSIMPLVHSRIRTVSLN